MSKVVVMDWLTAIRLRTLPLAVASAWCGGVLAEINGQGNRWVLYWTILTAVSLQIFSNLANDYGDAYHGADGATRQGPLRMVASGQITPAAMRAGLWVSGAACCLFGLALLGLALPHLDAAVWAWLGWVLLGGGCLAAAFYYTAGARPYGYRGWGDVAVFLFFGLVGVLGSEYLQGGTFGQRSWQAAAALGLWCGMVLNLNNMRDIETDIAAGKYTLAARLGRDKAKFYHAGMALIAWLLWWLWLPVGKGYLNGFSAAATLWHLYWVFRPQTGGRLDKLLPQWSLTVLAWVALLWGTCV